jgi:hypothetical protein
MLTQLGFFHFANSDKSQPLGSLEESISVKLTREGQDGLRNSLVVLPEAFNLKGEYEQSDSYEIESSSTVKYRLAQLAKRRGPH